MAEWPYRASFGFDLYAITVVYKIVILGTHGGCPQILADRYLAQKTGSITTSLGDRVVDLSHVIS